VIVLVDSWENARVKKMAVESEDLLVPCLVEYWVLLLDSRLGDGMVVKLAF